MSYNQSGLIEALDLNTLRSSALNVFGAGFGNSGYNQTVPAALSTPVVAGTDAVQADVWTALRSVILTSAQHQGTDITLLPPTTDLNLGDAIIAHDGTTDPDDFPQMVTNITSNRLVAAGASMGTTLGIFTLSSTNTWSISGTATIDFTWASENDARAFFNTGGQLRIRCSRSGGSATPQNTAWTNLCNAIGTTAIGHTATTSGGTGSGTGYFDLTGTATTIATATTGSGTYASNQIRIRAQRLLFSGANGGNGRQVRIFVDFLDNKTGAPDTVDGTLAVTADEFKATTFLTIASPVPSTIFPFSPS